MTIRKKEKIDIDKNLEELVREWVFYWDKWQLYQNMDYKPQFDMSKVLKSKRR